MARAPATKPKPKAKRKPRAGKTEMPPPFNVNVVRDTATSGVPRETLAVSLGVDLSVLSEKHLAIFDHAYARGVAIGVGDVFAGLKVAAVEGSTKAAEMLFELLGVRAAPPEPGTEDQVKPMRRLRVEVSTVDE